MVILSSISPQSLALSSQSLALGTVQSSWEQYPTVIQDWILNAEQQPSQAYCLNVLRQIQITFLNLGNIVYCPQYQLLLIFKQRLLYAYDDLLHTNFGHDDGGVSNPYF